MRGSPTEEFVETGVVFDVRAFCPQLKDTSRDALKDVDEVTLHNLDTGREATHELGEQLPRLERLRFRQSKLCSFRDLGCDLLNLRVLHAARCGVSDFDGVAALPALEELYLSFNDVEDCTALAFQYNLMVLDLESNRIADVAQLDALSTCDKLSCLTLLGCPIASTKDYRDAVAMALPSLEVLDDNKLNESDGDVVESNEEAALDEFIRQETELTAYSIKANAGSIHSPSHPCWAELRALRQGATQSSEASSLTHGGRGALNGRLRPQKKEQDPEEAALAKLRSRAAQSPPKQPKPFLASPSPTTKSGFRVLAPPGKPLAAAPASPASPALAAPVAAPVATPVAVRASPVKPKLDPNVVLRPTITSRASPRTDLVRELLGSPSVPTAKAVAEAPLTSAQKTTLKRRTRPKKKLHHAVSTFELAKRSAAKSAFADPATREVT
jgi:hypothetical protein